MISVALIKVDWLIDWLIDKLPGLPTPSHCAPSRSETCISSAAAAKYISVNFSSRKFLF